MANEKRLIDADALIEYIDEDHSYSGLPMAAHVLTMELLTYAPTIDAVEVVHGRWIAVPSSDMMTGKAFKCSECNKMRYGSFMPNYCQNCGARMDK